ncbi:Gfo/Idh/MocA family protein [Saccharopolyspora sp. 5N708]|uniref:Gfo/Idh/MocA family protein n=1 Tax=Saccharopolyspora sp. 5N708 TaxID=3457424 RepID=UPI003FCF543C
MNAVRFGLLGCSSIARRRFLPALARSSSRLVAVASRDSDRAARFGAEFGAEAERGYDELLARDDIDAVYLSVPTGLHARWALAAVQAGKHALVEKPFATTRADGERVLAAAADRGVQVMENRMFAAHPQHDAVAALVADGAIGALRAITAVMAIPPLPPEDIRYRADLGGGALLDVGYYPLHAALLHGGEQLSVVGATRRRSDSSDVDVSGAVLLRSASGVTAQVLYGFEHSYRSAYELWGDTGRIVLERAFTPPPTWQPVVRLEQQDRVEQRTLPPCDQFREALESFVGAVRGAHDLTAHHRRTLAGLSLIDAASVG